MSAPSIPSPNDKRENESFASRNSASIIGMIALGLIILATVWSMLRGP